MNKRIIALLGVMIVILSTAFAGCGKKVEVKNKEKTTKDGKIKLGEVYEDIPDGSEIIIGPNGDSYLVDGEGNSVIYEPSSAYVINNDVVVPVTPQNPQGGQTPSQTTTTTTTTTIKVIPSKPTTAPTTSQQQGIIKELTALRVNGKSDQSVKAKLTGYNAAALNINFQDGKNSRHIELHKGAYGSSTVGCEVGIYNYFNENGIETYEKISDAENITCSSKLYNGGENPIASFGTARQNIGWRYAMANGTLNGSPSGLIMETTINFTTKGKMDKFLDALEEMEYKEGAVNDAKTPKKYSVSTPEDGNALYSVTFVW